MKACNENKTKIADKNIENFIWFTKNLMQFMIRDVLMVYCIIIQKLFTNKYLFGIFCSFKFIYIVLKSENE